MIPICRDSRAAFRRSALALAGAALLGACSANDSFAPTTPDVPTSPNLVKGAAGPANHATFGLRDRITGTPVGGATFDVKNGDNFSYKVLDNSSLDLDSRPGFFDVVVDKAQATMVCLFSVPQGRTFEFNTPFCTTKPTTNKVTDFGLWSAPYPFSMYWWASVNGIPISQGTYKITGPNGFSMVVVANGLNDLATSQYVYVKVSGNGISTFTVCQTVPPIGTKLPANPCVSATLSPGTPVQLPIFVNKPL